jgi:hypothetical protein
MTLSSLLKHSMMQLLFGLFVFGVIFACINPLDLPELQLFELYAFWAILGLLGLGLVFFCINQSRLMFLAFAGCGTICMYLHHQTQIPLKPELADSSPTLQMSFVSLNDSTQNLSAILQTITDKHPHLLAIHQQNLECLDSIAIIVKENAYRYHQSYLLGTEERMDIFSKFPIQQSHILQIGSTSSIVGRLAIPSFSGMQELAFIASEFSNNSYIGYEEYHRQHLEFLVEQSRKSNIPLLLLGDYEKAAWSKELAYLRNHGNLQVSHRGVLAQAKSDKLPYLRIPTKHIFHSNHLRCIGFEAEKIGTSEQFGIFGTYQFVNYSDIVPNVIKTSRQF